MSKFYVVATPIGNLEDITLRALRVLGEVDLILCEDTRVTKKLLDRYEIKKPTQSYHSQSKISKVNHIFDLLREDKNLALVSDAGTPCISDPGVALIEAIRNEFGGEIEIISIPGPSALTAGLSIAGFPTHEFTFFGFLPHKKGRETLFKEMASSQRTSVFYESPHRILKTLESLNKFMPEKKIGLMRELTKIHEQALIGASKELLNYFINNPDKIRGEFVVIISAK